MLKWLGYFVLFLLLLSILLSIPTVQTYLGKFATNKLNKEFGTNIVVKKLDLSFLGSVQLKEVEIRDHHKDTLIFVKKLSTTLLNAKKIIDNKLDLGSVSLEDTHFYMKTYQGETDSNLTVFIDSFDDGSPVDSTHVPFQLKTENIYIDNLMFKVIDENSDTPLKFAMYKTGGNIQDFKLNGPEVDAKIRGLYFTDDRDLKITNFTTDYIYRETKMLFRKTRLQTPNSNIQATIDFLYKEGELADFVNKVKIKAAFTKSSFAIKDLKKLYTELSGADVLHFSGNMNGTLNDFTTKNIIVNSNKGLKIVGNLAFKNAVNYEKGFVFTGDLKNVTSNYNQLKRVLPNVLGNTLPSEFKKLGNFTLSGKTRVTSKNIEATLKVKSSIGTLISDLELTNVSDIDNATYSGDIEMINFDVGYFANNPMLGKISLKGDVNGSGFSLDNLNTTIIGTISDLEFNNYQYHQIHVNGQVKNKLFNGDLHVDDENLKMTFKGLADLSSTINSYNFKANIEHVDLQKTNLFKRDSIAILKGNMSLNMIGNTIEDMIGKASFKNIMYTNQKKIFNFKEFLVLSTIKDSIKKITIDSEDIVKGQIKGKFSFNQLLPMAQNALGSIYTNYNPYPVEANQFISFNFKVYNQIIDLFFSEIFIAKKTTVRGKIKTEDNVLKLTVKSPKIIAYGNEIKDLYIRTDNQNKLYNTHVLASEIKTKYYNVTKLNLLNKTENDTLFFKSIFKGGKLNKENFNLDFYYTINADKKSVVGIQKSSLEFKENTWAINPNDDKNNKITFDLKTDDFVFSPFLLTSKEQKIAFQGSLKDSLHKNLQAEFTKVKLKSLLPQIDSLDLKGLVNGSIDFVQKNGIYSPQGTILVDNFTINKVPQGNLALNIRGDNSFKKYAIDISLEKEAVKSIAATGFVDFSTNQPTINVRTFIEEYNLKAFSPLGQDVLSKIRGTASGNFTLKGFLENPDMEGSLTLHNAGLQFPYLNVDYTFEDEAVISLNKQSFVLENIALTDTKHHSKGSINGNITHHNFDSWYMNLEIDADNLLVLDTQNTYESLYYGTAFMKGTAEIIGLTDNLDININGRTEKGTIFVIPLKDIQTVENYKLIHFKSENKIDKEKQKELAVAAIKGLSLNINLEVTKDAIAQVVIDEEYGSQLKGSGTGDLQIKIDTRGTFTMYGDYTLDNGVYDFKYGGVVNKPFVIQKGSTVSWDGSPFEADLNITAVYKTKANPAVLLENFSSNRNIPIDLVTKITGGLFSSKQDLDIKLPNVDPAIASELDFILNDNDVNQKTTQFISLLVFGNFASLEKINFDVNVSNIATGAATSAIASAFSRLLSSSDSKFKLGLDYKQGKKNQIDNPNLNTDDQVDFSINSQISDRVIINGKFGVPIGANTQSSVVGEVKIELLLNKEGNFRGVIFNRQNEIQYTTDESGNTQGVGLSYQVNFNTLSDLFRKLKKKKKPKKTIKKDTILSQHKKLLNFKKAN